MNYHLLTLLIQLECLYFLNIFRDSQKLSVKAMLPNSRSVEYVERESITERFEN